MEIRTTTGVNLDTFLCNSPPCSTLRAPSTSSSERFESDRSRVVDEFIWMVLNLDDMEPRCRAEAYFPS